MISNLKLSIICATYNHEKYIKYALDSIIMQQVNFEYEVLIGEDCSTDKSRMILEKYERMYPGKFKIFYRDKNFGVENNFKDLYERARGEYLIVLETDDFWISKKKLQIEVDYLDKHSEYLAVAHKCIMVDENNKILNLKYPESANKNYTLSEFNKELLPGQTTTIMFRNYYLRNIGINTSLCTKNEYKIGPGDKRKAFMLAAQGKIACLDQYLSAYRYVKKGGNSYTANLSTRSIIDAYNEKIVFVKFAKNEIDCEKAVDVAEYQLVSFIVRAILKKEWPFNFKEGVQIIRNTNHKYKNIIISIASIIKSIILKPFGQNLMYKKMNSKKIERIEKIYENSDFIDISMKS